MDAGAVREYLRGLGHTTVTEVQIVGDDRQTWRLVFAPQATAQEQAAASSALETMRPQDVAAAQAMAGTRVLMNALFIKAFYRFFIYATQGGNVTITPQQIAEARTLMERCIQEAVTE